MRYYPIFLDIENKRVLVVGGGEVANRKVETLLEYGALVDIVSKDLTKKLSDLVEMGKVRYLGDRFLPHYLDGAFMVVAATDDECLNHEIGVEAKKRDMLVNAVDQPSDCNFIVPSVIRRGDLSVAISTSGKSPAFAKKIRKTLQSQFGPEYEIFLEIMGRLRHAVLKRHFSQEENSRIFNDVVYSGILDAISRNDWQAVESLLQTLLPEDLAREDFLTGIPRNRGEI